MASANTHHRLLTGRPRVVTLVTLGPMVCALAVVLFWPSTWSATATVMVQSGSQPGNLSAPLEERHIRMEHRILTSPALLRRLVASRGESATEADLRAEVHRIESALVTEIASTSDTIAVRLCDRDPEWAERTLDDLLHRYLSYRAELLRPHPDEESLHDRAQEYRKGLWEAEEHLDGVSGTSPAALAEREMAANLARIHELEKQWNELHLQLAELETTLRPLEKALEENRVQYFAFLNMGSIDGIGTRINELKAELFRMKRTYRPETEPLELVDDTLRETYAELRFEVEKILEERKLQLSALSARAETLKRSIRELTARNLELHRQANEYQRAHREAGLQAYSYETFRKQVEDARIRSLIASANLAGEVKILSWAEGTAAVSFPRPGPTLGYGVLFGFAGGLAALLLSGPRKALRRQPAVTSRAATARAATARPRAGTVSARVEIVTQAWQVCSPSALPALPALPPGPAEPEAIAMGDDEPESIVMADEEPTADEIEDADVIATPAAEYHVERGSIEVESAPQSRAPLAVIRPSVLTGAEVEAFEARIRGGVRRAEGMLQEGRYQDILDLVNRTAPLGDGPHDGYGRLLLIGAWAAWFGRKDAEAAELSARALRHLDDPCLGGQAHLCRALVHDRAGEREHGSECLAIAGDLFRRAEGAGSEPDPEILLFLAQADLARDRAGDPLTQVEELAARFAPSSELHDLVLETAGLYRRHRAREIISPDVAVAVSRGVKRTWVAALPGGHLAMVRPSRAPSLPSRVQAIVLRREEPPPAEPDASVRRRLMQLRTRDEDDGLRIRKAPAGSILLVEPDEAAADVFQLCLQGSEFEIAARVPSVEKAIDRVLHVGASLVVMNLLASGAAVPSREGASHVVKRILDVDPQARIVVTYRLEQRFLFMSAIRAGARAHIQRPFTRLKVLDALRKAVTARNQTEVLQRPDLEIQRSFACAWRPGSGGLWSVLTPWRSFVARRLDPSGIEAVLGARLEPGIVVRLSVEVPSWPQPLETLAEVRATKEDPVLKVWVTRFRFLELSRPARQELVRWIAGALGKGAPGEGRS